MTPRLVVAVDGGGSKTHAVVLDLDGAVLGESTGPGASPHLIGLDASTRVIDETVRTALAAWPHATIAHTAVYLSGLDLPPEIDAFTEVFRRFPWVPDSVVVENDLFALLRSGTDEPDAVAVVCGTGINAVGIRSDGAVVRFPALGMISGDWGGGWHLGEQALWHAARAVDGRGPSTSLVDRLPRVFGLPDIAALIEELHFERIPNADLARLCPAVFAAAASGDLIAGGLVDRQAEEIVALAGASLRRLGLEDSHVPVVLGGGVLAAADDRLLSGVRSGVARVAPAARIELVRARPLVGAAALALDRAGSTAEAIGRARRALAGPYWDRAGDVHGGSPVAGLGLEPSDASHRRGGGHPG
ncbi:MAG: BadF/BadG/BcrA/BcrD ATPase family protein [Leifsonia sp.]